MRILGIDPGLRKTGFGVVDVVNGQVRYLSSGTIVVPTQDLLYHRLKTILDGVRNIAQQYEVNEAAIEKVFLNSNPNTTLLLGQARGAALCALADMGLPVQEYTALQIKKSVVGRGHASKAMVQHMVVRLLNLAGTPSPDAADALACAICHAHAGPLLGLFANDKAVRMRAGRVVIKGH